MEILSPFDKQIAFAVVTANEDPPGILLPEEMSLVSDKAVEKRKVEVRRGRTAARRALAALGVTEMLPILRGDSREPLFPERFVGSISHTGSLAVAAAAHRHHFDCIGVDIEQRSERFTSELISQFASENEKRWIQSESSLQSERACMIFSAKESIFKALNPILKVWFGFDAAELRMTDAGGFEAKVRPFGKNDSREIVFGVAIVVSAHYILTGVALRSNEHKNLRRGA